MKIGVSGACGHLGTATVRELKARNAGHYIVGVSRTPETVAGADEARRGDYDDPETLATAYAELDRLLIIPSLSLEPGRRAAQSRAAIDAAVAAGVGHIVFMSSVGTRDVAEPHIWANYFAGEQHLMRNAPEWSILRMNYYAEAFVAEVKNVLARGALTGLAENRVAFVARDDLAAAAAGLLTGDNHAGAIYSGTGPRSVSGAERASLVAEITGQPLTFTVLSEEVLRDGLAAAGMPDFLVDVVVSIQQGFAEGGFDIVTGDIEKLSGRPPRPLEDILRADQA